MPLIFILGMCICLIFGSPVLCQNQNFEQDIKVLKGAFAGDMQIVYDAVLAGGNPNAVMTEEIGIELGLGIPWVDFLVIPALHMALGGGTEGHYQCASILLDAGADPNMYADKCPPAVLLALGYGKPVNEAMGVTLQTVFRDPNQFAKFELKQSIEDWNIFKGYDHHPPILSYAVEKQFLLGAFVLITDGKVDVNDADRFGVTPLHLSAWLGLNDIAAMLVAHNADVLAVDSHGRNALHYATLRGFEAVVEVFLNNKAHIPDKKVKKLLQKRDYFGFTPLDLSSLSPPHVSVVTQLQNKMTELNIYVESESEDNGNEDEEDEEEEEEGRYKKKPRRARASKSRISDDIGISSQADIDNGWICSSESTPMDRAGVDEIDVRHYSELSEEIMSRDYMGGQRPVLITGNMTGQGAEDQGLNSWGIIPYASTLAEVKSASEINVPLADWLDEMRSNTTRTSVVTDQNGEQVVETAPWIAYDTSVFDQLVGGSWTFECLGLGHCLFSISSIPEIFDEDMQAPAFATKCDGNFASRRGGIQLSIGGYLSGAPVHAHRNTWNLLLTGRKRWFLFPPGAIGPRPLLWASVRPSSSDLELYKALHEQGRSYELTQRPGDVLFVPAGWAHATINMCETVSVSEEFCGPQQEYPGPPALTPSLYGIY
eukprot:gene1268-2453_t